MTNQTYSRLILGACALFAATAQGAITPKVIDDGATLAWENPDIVADSKGYLHIAVLGIDASSFSEAEQEVYYFRINSSGTILNGPIQVSTTDGVREGRPRIVVTSDRKAVIVWRSSSSETLRAALVDPSADAVEIAETVVGTTTSVYEPFVAIDSNDLVHAMFESSSSGGTIRHIRFAAADLNEAAAVTGIAEHDTAIIARGYPGAEATTDPDGNVHIALSGNSGEAAYAMLDTAGVVKISSTTLYDGTEPPLGEARHFSIWSESSGIIGIVYGDSRQTDVYAGEGGESFYVRLDPSLDDRNGNAATMATIRVGDDVRVGGHFYGKAFRSSGVVHILSGVNPRGYGQIAYQAVDADDGRPLSRTIIENTFNASATTDYRAYVKGARNTVVWTQSVFSPTLVGYTNQLVTVKASTLKAAGDGGGGGGGGLDLTLLGALGLMALRRRARARAA